MTPARIVAALIAALFLLMCSLSFFTVQEGSAGLILRLGKIVLVSKTKEPEILRPGLHVKIPLIDKVRIFDMRMQELAATGSRSLTVVTKEQTYLVVEYFAKWHINNLARFYTSTGGSITWAETLLEQRLNDIVRAEYGRRTSDQVISAGRADLMQAIREQADTVGKDQGINVIDVRIQQITLPPDVMGSVFKRMETERKQFAEAKRAEGIEKSEEIRALADQKVSVIKAQALMQGASIRAKGDLDAAEIYAQAYNANPGFYSYYRSLQAYENSFAHKSDILILKPEGQFFSYFHNSKNGMAVVGKR
ncbi:MAG TPA: protease modulator HflC [Gammaproteobacteria bacterium]|nr:protease modulator HflC [Gammaproteobacteria bacterium]